MDNFFEDLEQKMTAALDRSKLTSAQKLIGGYSVLLTIDQANQWAEHVQALPTFQEYLRATAAADALSDAVKGGAVNRARELEDLHNRVNDLLGQLYYAGKAWHESLKQPG